MDEKVSQLSEVIAEIKPVRRSYAELLEQSDGWADPTPPAGLIVERFFLSEIADIITLLTLIDNSSKRLFERKSALRKADIFEYPTLSKKLRWFPGKVAPTEQIWSEEELPLFIKALYEWIFHISELFRKNPKTIGKKFPNSGPLREQLIAYCDFRAKLITHKSSKVGDVWGGHTMETESGEIELWVLRMKLGKDEEVLKNLFTKYSEELKLDPPQYDHMFSWIRILAKHRHELTGTIRDELEKFIARNGFISQTPTQIARFIKEMLSTMMLRFSSKVSK